MVFLVREIPLDPDPAYEVKYVGEVVSEIAERDDAEELMDELEAVLGVDPLRPPGRRSKTVEGTDDLRRYRPHVDNDLRVFYAVETERAEVWILGLHPRSQAYRSQNLRTAARRYWRREG